MNYINLINQFWEVNERHCFGASEIALYFHLLKVCNSKSWENPFTHHNLRVCAEIGLSEKTIKKSKDKLVQAGLLTYKSGKNKREYTVYRMVEKIPTIRTTKPTTNPPTNEDTNRSNVYINLNLNENYIHIGEEKILNLNEWVKNNYPLQIPNWQQIYPLVNIHECLKEFLLRKAFQTFNDWKHFQNSLGYLLRELQEKNQKEKNSGKKEKEGAKGKAQSLMEQDAALKRMHEQG